MKKRISLAVLLSFLLVIQGCNYTVASTTVNIIGSVIAIAKADLPSLESTGIIPAVDIVAVNAFLAVAGTLDSQAASCIVAAKAATNNKSAFLACFQVFSTGLLQSSELAALRLLNPSTQKQTQLWVAAITTALDSIIVAFGGTVPASASAVSASPDYQAFMNRVKADHKANPHRVM